MDISCMSRPALLLAEMIVCRIFTMECSCALVAEADVYSHIHSEPSLCNEQQRVFFARQRGNARAPYCPSYVSLGNSAHLAHAGLALRAVEEACPVMLQSLGLTDRAFTVAPGWRYGGFCK